MENKILNQSSVKDEELTPSTVLLNQIEWEELQAFMDEDDNPTSALCRILKEDIGGAIQVMLVTL